jgi:outer membrane protein assembly factor BamD
MGYWVWSPESGKFVNPEGAVEDTAQEQYDYALKLYEAKQYDKAEDELKKLVKKFPSASAAAEAQFQLAVLYEEQQQFYKAFRAYQRVVEKYPQSPHMAGVIERQFRIGNVFLSGQKSKVMGVPILPALPRAIEVFDQVVKNAPFSPFGDKAVFNLGIAYKRSGNMPKALETFQFLIDQYPESTLVPDAKFQLGEVAYGMAQDTARYQEQMDVAEEYFEDFIADYPDTNVQEKAEKLKQAIDEKNAEKNFKVAQYYEKSRFLSSALIYYEDVASNYPDSSWGKKAQERLAFYRSPGKFIKARESVFQAELAQVDLRKGELEEKLAAVPKGQESARQILSTKLRDLGQQEKDLRSGLRDFSHRKVSDVEARRKALEKQESELTAKKKALQRKRREMSTNPSPELQRAFASWEQSLGEETVALEREKLRLFGLEKELGVKPGLRLPFGRGSDRVEDLRKMNVDALAELMEEKRLWNLKKEELYDFRNEVLARLDSLEDEDVDLLSEKKEFQDLLAKHSTVLRDRGLALDREKAEMEILEDRLAGKMKRLETFRGPAWRGILSAPTKAVRKSLGAITFSGGNPREKLAQARARQKKLARLMTSRRGIVESLRKSFDTAVEPKKEAQEPVAKEPRKPKERGLAEEIQFRRRMKLLEREIRWRYEEIQDRNRTKRGKMAELDRLLKERRERSHLLVKSGRVAGAPAVGMFKFFRAFLFGLRPEGERLRDEAKKVSETSAGEAVEGIRKLREELELEALLIESRAHEVDDLEEKLQDLQREITPERREDYRTLFVELPGSLFDQIVENTKKAFPKKKRMEILIDGLDRETRKMQALEEEKDAVDAEVRELERAARRTKPEEKKAPSEAEETGKPDARPSETAVLEEEAAALGQQYRERRARYEAKRTAYRAELKGFYQSRLAERMKERFGFNDQDLEGKREVFAKERERTEEELLKVLKKQERISRRQEDLLKDKKEKVEKTLSQFRKSEDVRSSILEKELRALGAQIQDVKHERQGLAEERQRLFENLKTEVKVSSLER